MNISRLVFDEGRVKKKKRVLKYDGDDGGG